MNHVNELTVSLLYYEVRGMALIRDWYDNVGSVEMKPYTVENWSDAGTKLNDAGFGAKEILGAKLHVYAVYGPKEPELAFITEPLKIKTDTFYITCDSNKSSLTEAERKFLDDTDTSIPMRLMPNPDLSFIKESI